LLDCGDRGRADLDLRQLDHAPHSGLIGTVPLARAMARRDPLEFQRLFQDRSYALDLRQRRHNEMETSSQRIDTMACRSRLEARDLDSTTYAALVLAHA
jgi:hypothetical protein